MRKEMSDVTKRIVTGLCKYVLLFCIIAYIYCVYSYSSTKDVPFEKTKEALLNSMNDESIQNLMDVSSRGLKRYYGFNAAEYDGVMMYIGNNGLSAEEILLIKVNDEKQMNELEAAIKQRMKTRIKDFENYAPDQAQLLREAELIIKGKYIFLAVSENADKYKRVFLKLI